MFPARRKRRVLYYDPASQQAHSYIDQGVKVPNVCGRPVTDEQSFLDNRTGLTFGTQVDTYLWHISNGCDPPYNTPAEEILWPCLGSYERVRDIVIDACHHNGVEVWASLRMNDLHSSFRSKSLADADEPFKTEHPEYLLAPESVRELPAELTENRLWMGLHYAHEEVRQYRHDYVVKTAAAHDFDGYELDFSRMGISFPLGQEREHASKLTELIRQVRSSLEGIGAARGRPYTFAVHVMDSLETSLELGMEVELWAREGLVDVLLVGMGFLPSVLKIDQWVELARDCGVQIYPTINTNAYRYGVWPLLTGEDVYHEGTRASSSYYLQQGADGIYLFNFSNEPSQMIPDDSFRAVLSDVGDLETLAGKDKVFGIQPVGHGCGPYYLGNESALLPIALDRFERKIPLRLGPDAGDSHARRRLRLWISGGGEGATLWVRINHRLMPEPTRDGNWYDLEIPNDLMRSGHNELSIWCNVPAGGVTPDLVGEEPDEELAALDPLILHNVFVTFSYGGGGGRVMRGSG